MILVLKLRTLIYQYFTYKASVCYNDTNVLPQMHFSQQCQAPLYENYYMVVMVTTCVHFPIGYK